MTAVDIVEFLTARHDEEQRNLESVYRNPNSGVMPYVLWGSGSTVMMSAVRFDAELAAKRRTVARHADCGSDHGYCDADEGWTGNGNAYLIEDGRCADLCEAAALYESHPDYDPAWRPED